MDMQKKLHEQLEAQRQLQLSLEQHGRYISNLLEKSGLKPPSMIHPQQQQQQQAHAMPPHAQLTSRQQADDVLVTDRVGNEALNKKPSDAQQRFHSAPGELPPHSAGTSSVQLPLTGSAAAVLRAELAAAATGNVNKPGVNDGSRPQ